MVIVGQKKKLDGKKFKKKGKHFRRKQNTFFFSGINNI